MLEPPPNATAVLPPNDAHGGTRHESARTFARVLVELALRRLLKTPRYQLLAAKAAWLYEATATLKAIAERFAVDDYTAAKVVRCFRQR